MATKSIIHPNMLDILNMSDPDGKIASIAEILNETNDVLDDMVWMEGNLPTGHKSTVRKGIPAGTWRKMYGGVQPTKSTAVAVTDTTGMLEAYAEIDKALADLNGNTNEYRLQQERAHIEGMGQQLATALFYGDETVNPEQFTGLSPRYNSLTGAENSDNVIGAGGSGSDNASIWLICWGHTTVTGIYPKGSKVGLQHENKGQVTIENIDGAGGRMEAYRSHYRHDVGLALLDWRFVVRICNIDKSNLTADAATGANLPELMFEATELLPNMNGRCSWYMSRDVRTKVRQQATSGTKSSTLSIENVGGKRIMFSHDVPMARVDALSADEAAVT